MAEECVSQEESFVEDEEWRPIVGFNGRYEVSISGRVRSLDWHRRSSRNPDRKFFIPGRMKVISRNQDGYPIVSLSGGNRSLETVRTVHSLVARMFIGEKPEGFHVLHKNDDRNNNHVSNLYYGTEADNGRDRVKNQRSSRGEARHNAVLTEENVRQIRAIHQSMSFEALGRMFGVTGSTVSSIVKRRIWRHVE